MALIEIKRDPTTRELRQFALLWLPAFCFAASLILIYRWAAWPMAVGLVGSGVLSIVLGILQPRWMRIVFVGWMWAAFPIGWTVSHLLMGSIYFLVITPIGWIMRLMGRDPLARKFDRNVETYWTPRARKSSRRGTFASFSPWGRAMTNPEYNRRAPERFAEEAGHRRPGVLGELVQFLRHNKKWWLTPIVIMLLLVGVLVILGSTAAAPFIYTLF